MTTPTFDELTGVQARVLDAIRHYWAAEGIAPTIRDLMRETGYQSTSTVHGAVAALEAGGYVSHKPGLTRSIRLLDTAKNSSSVD